MDIEAAKRVLLRTHAAALRNGHRANGMYLVSPPGVGKSDGVRQYTEALAKEHNEPAALNVFMLATIQSVDVRGFMIPTKAEVPGGPPDTVFSTPPWYPTRANSWIVEPNGTWHAPGTWKQAMPRIGVLFLDEFGQAETDVKKPAAELIYKGNVGTCSLQPGYRVVAAGNRVQDRSGVLRELMFLVNRRCELSIDPNLPAWLNWANRQPPEQRPHYLTISFAEKNPDIVFADAVPTDTAPFCTPRTLCLLDQDLQALRSDKEVYAGKMPLDPDAREVAAGWIGQAAAAQYFTHMKYADELPSIKEIIDDPMEAKLPERKDAQMVAGYMLAHNVTAKNAAKLMKYVGRLHIEMQVLCVRATMAQEERAKDIVSTPEYTQWLMKNKELIVASRS